MRRALVLCLALAGCSGGDNPPPPPPPPALIDSVTLPAFDFPVYDKQPTTQCLTDPTCAKVGYVTQSVYGKIAGTITFSFEIIETGNPVYQYKLNPDNVCENPANLHLFFQMYGDNGTYEFGRWWSSTTAVLGPGPQTVSVPIVPDQWSSVYGKSGKDAATQYLSAINRVGAIGITFGGGCFAGHGVNISGGGSSRFIPRSYGIK